ncbi:MAG: hypothetical protein KAS12_05005 [Candidatus Aenigmarchaeota archaeon]|nr:hypothetical protein [Candidatus Aenigmarchaeota archaeon]
MRQEQSSVPKSFHAHNVVLGRQKRVIWLVVIFSIIIIGGLFFYFSPISNKFFPNKLNKQYQQQLQQVCQQFCPNGDWLMLISSVQQADTITKQQQIKQQIKQLKDKLLVLRVSKQYQELHLNLVIVLSLLEQGLNNDSDKIIVAEKQLQQLLNNYFWLTPIKTK